MTNKLIQDFSKLPRRGNTDQIDWSKAVGKFVDFILDDMHGSYQIIKYENQNKQSYVTLLYNGNTYRTKTIEVRGGGILTFLRGHRCKRKEFNIGDVITRGIRTFTVLGVKIQSQIINGKRKFTPYYYLYCHDCKGTFWREYKEMRSGCPICSGNIIVPGINDIMSTAPELEPYFAEEDKWMLSEYSSGVNKKIKPVCPNCGTRSNKYYTINQLRHKGFACGCNSDGISYPEKFISCVLDQLHIPYIRQATTCDFGFDVDHKKYDFYLPYHSCIIEANGIQHFDDKDQILNWRTYEEEKSNDEYKRKMAIDNGIKYYFDVDCRQSTLKYIKKSLFESGIGSLLQITEENIDWKSCDEYATKNIIKTICDEFMNDPLSLKKIRDNYHMHKETLRDYMRKGAKFNWINYDLYRVISQNTYLNKMINPDGDIFYFKTKEEIRKYYKSRNIPYNMSQINKIFDTKDSYHGYYFYTITSKSDVLKILDRDEHHYFYE